MRIRLLSCLVALIAAITPQLLMAESHAKDQKIYKSHAFTLFGEPKYPADFTHYDWVNPDAPKKGTITSSKLGGFNNFNSWTDKGDSAAGLRGIYERMMVGASDEKATYYGLIAHTMEWPEDRTWIKFYMRPEAKFSDGTPITADDVVFSVDALKTRTSSFYQQAFDEIGRVEKIDDYTVVFHIKEGEINREFPLTAGGIDILPKHWWDDKEFTETWMDIPLGSGPYVIKDFEANRFVEWHYNPDYWGADLPVYKGMNNFLVTRDEYYKDSTVMRNAFKGGAFDIWTENRSKSWATEYEPGKIKALDEGFMVKELIPDGNPQPFQSMMFNYSRPYLNDWRVRRAVNTLFNFEWTNKTIFFDAYTRTDSLFANTTDLRAEGLPTGKTLEILDEFRDQLNPKIFSEVWSQPVTDGSKNNRESLKLALQDFQDAGFKIERSGANKGKLIHQENGDQLKIEFLFYSDNFDAILAPLVDDLQKLGVDASLKRVDTQSWINRLRERNFDITSITYSNSFFPGEEQRGRYHSEFSEIPLSWNLTGMKNPVMDALTERLVQQETYEDLTAYARAMDFVLKWDHPGLFEWYLAADRMVYWNRFAKPDKKPEFAVGTSSWWLDEEKDAAIKASGYRK